MGGHALASPPWLSTPSGRQLESVRAEAAEKGDVGLVAENSRSTQRLMLPPPALTASGVFAKFQDIARLTGSTVIGTGRGSPPQHPDPLRLTSGTPKPCVWQEDFRLDFLGPGCFSSAAGCGAALPTSRSHDRGACS